MLTLGGINLPGLLIPRGVPGTLDLAGVCSLYIGSSIYIRLPETVPLTTLGGEKFGLPGTPSQVPTEGLTCKVCAQDNFGQTGTAERFPNQPPPTLTNS